MKLFLEVLFILGMIVEPFAIRITYNKLMNALSGLAIISNLTLLLVLVADYVWTVSISASYFANLFTRLNVSQ